MGSNREARRARLREKSAPLAAVPEEGHPKPIFAVESRPSRFTGIGFWAVLTYKEHLFEEMLPPDFMGLDEAGQALASAAPFERLRAKLAPILIAEDMGEPPPCAVP